MLGIDHLPPAVRATMEHAMREAIVEANKARFHFGAVLVDIDSGEIVYRAFNTRKDGDPTAHGEINALRGAGLAGIDLTRTVLFSTAEPCPMCAAACAWARVAGVVYGTTVESLIAFGWHQFGVTIEAIVDSSPFPPVPWVGGYMAELTDPLFSDGPPVIATDPVYAR